MDDINIHLYWAKMGVKVNSDVLHKPWHRQASQKSITHTIKDTACNCIFYEAPVKVCGVYLMKRLLFLGEITGFV